MVRQQHGCQHQPPQRHAQRCGRESAQPSRDLEQPQRHRNRQQQHHEEVRPRNGRYHQEHRQHQRVLDGLRLRASRPPPAAGRNESGRQRGEQAEHHRVDLGFTQVHKVHVHRRPTFARRHISIDLRQIPPRHRRERLVPEIQTVLPPVPGLTAGEIRHHHPVSPVSHLHQIPPETSRRPRHQQQEEPARKHRRRHQPHPPPKQEVSQHRRREGLDGNRRSQRQAPKPFSASRRLQERPVHQGHNQDVGLAQKPVVHREDGHQQRRQPIVPGLDGYSFGDRQSHCEARGDRQQSHVEPIPQEEEGREGQGAQGGHQHRESRWIPVVRKMSQRLSRQHPPSGLVPDLRVLEVPRPELEDHRHRNQDQQHRRHHPRDGGRPRFPALVHFGLAQGGLLHAPHPAPSRTQSSTRPC